MLSCTRLQEAIFLSKRTPFGLESELSRTDVCSSYQKPNQNFFFAIKDISNVPRASEQISAKGECSKYYGKSNDEEERVSLFWVELMNFQLFELIALE